MPPPNPADLDHALAAAALTANSTLRRLAKWMIEHREEMGGLTISGLATATGVGETTVFRLCRMLGFSGYRDLRLALAESRGAARANKLLPLDVPLDMPLDTAGTETLGRIVRRIVEVHVETLHDTLRLTDPAVLDRATEQLLRSRHVHLIGFGTSAPIAEDASQRFLRLGLVATAHSDPHVMSMLAANPPPRSLFFAISYSGQTRDLVETLEAAGRRRCPRIALTSNPHGAITEFAETVLVSAVRRSPLAQQEWIATRISQLAIIDMLCVNIALHHPRKADFVHEGVLFERELAKKLVPQSEAAPVAQPKADAHAAKRRPRIDRSGPIASAAAIHSPPSAAGAS